MSNRKERRDKGWFCGEVEPGEVNGLITARSEFYRGELYKLVKSLFKIKCPLEWEKDYMKNLIVRSGYFIIANTSAGIIPCRGSLSGYNYWDYPTKAVIDMPILGSFERTLGKDCVLIYLERQFYRKFYNFNKLIDVYSYKLAAADAAIDINLINSRMAYVAEAESKAQSETIKKMYDDVLEGKPLVVYRGSSIDKKGLALFFGNIKQNYIANDVQDSKRTILNELLTTIGINNANTDKKERLVTNEVESNNVELMANTYVWKDNLKTGNKRVEKTFPDLEFKISLKFDAKKLDKQVQSIASSTVEQGGKKNDSMGDN